MSVISQSFNKCLALALLLMLVACDGRTPAEGPSSSTTDAPEDEPHVAVLDFSRGVPETSSGGLFSPARPNTLAHFVLAMDELSEDENVKGYFVRLGLASLSLARADEVGRRLGEVRAAGVPVICHADGYGNGTVLMAARGCDEIWVSPAGGVETVGLAGQLVFGRALLDKLKVDVDFLQVGDYKGAEEPFTRNSSSPEARASLQNALGAIRESWLKAVAEGRGKSAEALALEEGPHTPKQAMALGLVDAVGFASEARAQALERAGVTGSHERFGGFQDDGGGLADVLRALGGGAGGSDVPHVAVIHATGAIAMASSGGLLGGSDGIAARDLGPTLVELTEDDAVKAVVLRLDSPGGSALASDLLWKELMDLRDRKPLIISVGGMAASGGYYMACAGTKVVVEQNAIIGSIGVVGGKLSFARSLAEVGITVENVPAVEGGTTRSLYGSPLTGWDEATRKKVRASIAEVYNLFLERITTGRGLTRADVEPYAAGRLMGGQQAVDAKLADEVGGLRRAIDLALELSGESDIPVELRDNGGALSDLFGVSAETPAPAEIRLELEREVQRRVTRLSMGPWVALRPELETFLASTLPLLGRERVLAALPYALTVR